MKTLINPETISNNTIDSVYNEVSEMLTNRGYNVVSNEEEAREMFAALYSEPSAEMYTREAQTFAVPGRVAGSFEIGRAHV